MELLLKQKIRSLFRQSYTTVRAYGIRTGTIHLMYFYMMMMCQISRTRATRTPTHTHAVCTGSVRYSVVRGARRVQRTGTYVLVRKYALSYAGESGDLLSKARYIYTATIHDDQTTSKMNFLSHNKKHDIERDSILPPIQV